MFTKSFLKAGGGNFIFPRMISSCASLNQVIKSVSVPKRVNAWRRSFSVGGGATGGGEGGGQHYTPPPHHQAGTGGTNEPFSGSTDNSQTPPPSFGYVHDKEGEDEFQIKLNILETSLNHVNTMGWSYDALRAGAADLNLSESISSLCTPFDLVEYFQRSSNQQLEAHLKSLDKKDKSLYSTLEYRLKLVIPFIDRYHQAMGLSLEPVNIPRSLEVLRELSDIVCINGLGDLSTDLRWYTKRTGVSSIYVATECCMVQDKSEGFKETWDFLERRVKDYELVESVGSAALPAFQTGVITLLNILGMNRRR